ncbi:MAG: M20/M25/M40 family metallo-hydrolase [Acidaminococcaceae bacterium]|nr:M20/M25/M40 family metallo-hydrolase [Acidaminococcaceae bacterium]
MQINKERVLQEFFELISIPCLSKNERQVADLLTKRLEELGGTVTEDQANKVLGGNTGNLVANFKGTVATAPKIMVSAHMDCVAPCDNIKPQIVDGVIKSDGTTILGGDDKGGVVAILETLRVLKEKNIPHGDIQVVFSVCEEQGVAGAKNIDKSLIGADFGYSLDSSGRPGKIINAAPGQNKIFAKIHGKTSHGGVSPEKGINAIKAAGEIIVKVPSGRIDEETTCNMGIINGGRATNIVPDLVEIACDARSRNQAKLDNLTKTIVDAFENSCTMEGVRVEVEVVPSYGSYLLDNASSCISLAQKAAERLGLPVNIGGTGGGSDANHYNNFGIPTTVLGTGMTNVHTCDEILLEEDLYVTAEWLLEILTEAGGTK